MSDGTTRCLPLDRAVREFTFFADADCTEPAVKTRTAPPPYVFQFSSDDCNAVTEVLVFRRTDEVDVAYEKRGDDCVVNRFDDVVRLEPVPDETFVALAESVVPVTADLEQIRARSPSGLLVGRWLRAKSTALKCVPRDLGEDTLCVRVDTSVSPQYEGPTCEEQTLFHRSLTDGCGPATYTITTSDCRTATLREVVEEITTATTTYEVDGQGQCVATPHPPRGQSLRTRPVTNPAALFPRLTRAELGTGRLRAVHFAGDDVPLPGLFTTFRDTALDLDCRVTPTRGEPRCVPSPTNDIASYFSDAECTTEVEVVLTHFATPPGVGVRYGEGIADAVHEVGAEISRDRLFHRWAGRCVPVGAERGGFSCRRYYEIGPALDFERYATVREGPLN